jgi:hypothetical protein
VNSLQRAGLVGNEFEGIFFTEMLAPPGCQTLKFLTVSRNRQNSNLGEIKKLMATEAMSINANAIVGFKYGQRTHKWWQQVFTFKWDSEAWFGEGNAVRLD